MRERILLGEGLVLQQYMHSCMERLVLQTGNTRTIIYCSFTVDVLAERGKLSCQAVSDIIPQR